MIPSLRNRIPAFDCVAGCHDCCGRVPWSAWEAARLPGDVSVKTVKAKEVAAGGAEKCGFVTDGGQCAVYAQRPIMCRLFGAVEDLRCPHGRGPERFLSKEEAGMLLAEYIQILKGGSDHADSLRCAC